MEARGVRVTVLGVRVTTRGLIIIEGLFLDVVCDIYVGVMPIDFRLSITAFTF